MRIRMEERAMGESREGDWECNGCNNRNYAFRLFYNRCKQPRLLVDTKTPADSNWLPHMANWICAGCTNNNYASREKCKKCGQPRDIAAMPTILVPGASLPTYSHYFARAPGAAEQKMNIRLGGNGAVRHLPLSSNWSLAVTKKYGVNSAASWPLAGNRSSGLAHDDPSNQAPPFVKEWCNGDWICDCGFHNYFSHAQALGIHFVIIEIPSMSTQFSARNAMLLHPRAHYTRIKSFGIRRVCS